MSDLVIVESPTKARTLTKFLGSKYRIEASMGHIRDLPKGDLGIDIEDNFEPKYIIPRDKKKRVNELKKVADKAETIYLASDPDREGEAIAWHLSTLLGKGHKLERVEFHEITESAIKDAFAHPRALDLKLVDAQQARRVLDRLVGYKLSPLLWKKVKRGLSAGRVQTVALRLVVEREREIEAFNAVEYWSVMAELESSLRHPEPDSGSKGSNFWANLLEFNGKKLVVWNEETKNDSKVFFVRTKEEAETHVEVLKTAKYQITKITQKEVKRFAPGPFTTSTLQQTSGNKLGYTAKRTMMLAQNLYEQGFITYMRTDSMNLSVQAVTATRSYIEKEFGKQYLPNSAKIFTSKSKNAQEAHEAIRPTNVELDPEKLNGDGFTRDHKRLYELIWKRTLACQMAEAVLDQTTVDVKATTDYRLQTTEKQKHEVGGGRKTVDKYLLRANGSILKFDGWLRLYGVSQALEDEKEDDDETKKQVLPKLSEGENLDLLKLLPEQHFTQPPPRYTESSLIKKLEELGIGRPSTYAPTLATIQDRFYVEKEDKKFKPTVLGLTTSDFLIKYFPDIFDYTFTAHMEDELDEISLGKREWKKTISEFYTPMASKLETTMETAEHANLPVETVDKICPECGKQLVVRTGKFGKFLACSGFPDCKHTEPFDQKIDAICPKDGGDVVMRKTKKGRTFYGCKNYPKCDWASWNRPKPLQEQPEVAPQ